MNEEYDYLNELLNEVLEDKNKCSACNHNQPYVVPAFCKDHYLEWLKDRHLFERQYYNGYEI